MLLIHKSKEKDLLVVIQMDCIVLYKFNMTVGMKDRMLLKRH
jgi:hypothetical protein